MRFVSAVALALVMLWVPVDVSGQSGQEVTMTAVDMSRRGDKITFVTRNNTSRTIVAWRGDLQIRNPFNDLIWEAELIFGEDGDLPPNGTNTTEQSILSILRKSKPDGMPFFVRDYQLKDMKFRWTNVRVVY